MNFPTDYKSILERIENIDPLKYAQTRNFVDGDVTYLSPYISRGVISLRQIAQHVLIKYKPYQIEKFLQELAWREYWQRVWQNIGDKIFTDIKQEQPDVVHRNMVTSIEKAETGIEVIDKHIQLFYQTGYMHNHIRMYVSSIACNVAKAHWLKPSQWMYFHLLDGDIASNSLSWQWIAGSFSSKKYFCNQENINKYTQSQQQHTFLDCLYEQLPHHEIPPSLLAQSNFLPITSLPNTPELTIKEGLPILIYNGYNLDPEWYAGAVANRILLLEPSHYKKHPVSEKVIRFIIALSKNIDGIQISTGEFEEIERMSGANKIIFKSHPSFMHYRGSGEKYDELFPDVTKYFPSFFGYWKRCKQYLIPN